MDKQCSSCGGFCRESGYERENVKIEPEPKIINMEAFIGSGKPVVPVCWMNANDIDKTDWKVWAHGKPTVSMPLFASPPKKEWVGLTDEERDEICLGDEAIARAIEAKLKEKNT